MKDRWHNSTPDDNEREVLSEKSLSDQASALAFIQWRTALNSAIDLHAEDYRYDNDHQRVGVITEYLAFQIQLIDRLCSEFLLPGEREVLVNGVCQKAADQIQENLEDIAGPGDYKPPFIALLNKRFSDYAEFRYKDGRPGYEAMRYLGYAVLMLLGEDQTNRWVIDQVMEIDGPAIVDQNIKSMNRLFGRE
ncbi:MAG: hypothetical protein KTR35_17790 [Gammaproteobacteria bacterium]|nr:hypothetical protein [Gammaproteobacteria bacterium]